MTQSPPPYPGINGYNGYAAPGAAAYNGPNTNGMSSADAKAAEAAASAMPPPQAGWVDPRNPYQAYVPNAPPTHVELPPTYDDATKKEN